MRFIAHVTDAFHTLHRRVVEAPDRIRAAKAAIASVPRGRTASARRDDAPHSVFVASRPPLQ